MPIRKASEQSLRDVTSPNTADSSFMGGIALRRAFDGNRQEPSGSTGQTSTDKPAGRTKPVPPPINTDISSRRPSPMPIKDAQNMSSFVAPTDPQNKVVATGKRPAGSRLTSEPPTLAATAQAVVETQRAKKGLPFLKNSMSGLLLRRKASQNAPDLHPLPLPRKPAETAYQPIRGTRVHDFSAPRTRTVPTRQPTVLAPETALTVRPQDEPEDLPSNMMLRGSRLSWDETLPTDSQVGLLPTDSEVGPLPTDSEAGPLAIADGAESNRSLSTKSRPISTSSSMKRVNPSTRTSKSRHLSVGDDAVGLSALPRHMKSTSSRFSFDMKGISEAAMAEKVLEERHRQKQLEKEANGESVLRDSRFDDFDDDAFDYDAAMMGDGLEEEIPQIGDDYDEDDYLPEEVSFEEEVPLVREEFLADEDQEYEHKANDGEAVEDEEGRYEEGENEDYQDEDDQDDPDNDQENFAGFVFTRSKQNSSLVSPATPGMLNTPLDATGRPIGYAFTKEGTPVLGSATSRLSDEGDDLEEEQMDASFSGLGIRGLEASVKAPPYDPTVFQERRNLPPIEDLESGQDKGLYYDGGLLEELQMEASEIQESTFDENLFDLDDVDQYGRPLPGVFQQNLDLRVKAQGHKQRDSDVTSPGSEASGSTAHTSVSVGMQANSLAEMALIAKSISSLSTAEDNDPTPSRKIAVAHASPPPTHESYQLALLEGVQKAAASGWKSRWDNEDEDDVAAQSEVEGASEAHGPDEVQVPVQVRDEDDDKALETSPDRDYDFTITSPTTASQPSTAGLPRVEAEASQVIDSIEDNYPDDDVFEQNYLDDNAFDDDDYFDDDFIAEANAEALAYDDEGFYGTEFGFYSAPPPVRPTGTSASESEPPTGKNFLGGYFGPSNIVSRTLSGRVPREPILTPITEVSETPGYSNRNSMLSMGLPSATLAELRILSPGLAHMGGGHGDGLDYTLGSLNQLRNRTFGDSQISLNSSREGSPRSERAPMHSERTEVLSPMPWDIARPQSQLSMSHDRKNLLWSPTDAAGSPGFPPPPLFSPPPIPRSSDPPVLEDDGEKTVRNTPTASEGELSPAGTFGLEAEEESSLHSLAFGMNDTAAALQTFKGVGGGIEETEPTEESTSSHHVLLGGPVVAHDALRRGSL